MSSWDMLARKHFGVGGAASRAWSASSQAAAESVRRCSAVEHSRAVDVLHDAVNSIYFSTRSDVLSWPVFDASDTAGLRMQMFARSRHAAKASAARLMPLVSRTVAMLRSIRRPELHILYVDDTMKRCVPRGPIQPEHINGGMTISSMFSDRMTVIVYRREDAAKVMIHELLHAHGVDENIRGDSAAEARAMASFGVRQVLPFTRSIGLGEAYTETLACHLLSVAFGRRGAVQDASNKLAKQLLGHFGRSSMLVQDREDQQRLPIAEGTHATAYVLGRAALLQPACLRLLLDTYPPGKPPTNADGFCTMLLSAASRWDREHAGASQTQTKATGNLGFERLALAS